MVTPEPKTQGGHGQPQAPPEKPQASGAKAAHKKKEKSTLPIPFRKDPWTSFATEKLAFFQDDHALIKEYIEYTKATAPQRPSDMPYPEPEIQARILRAVLGILRKDKDFEQWEKQRQSNKQ
ncbi:MAG: hypothetical protein LBC63_03060 [Holophagales bacterium]|jgi:hypothetical protein|nr:hypothetical protein [Holophagales bacterium]